MSRRASRQLARRLARCSRGLAREGRSIVIGLDESSLSDFESSTAGAPHGHPPDAEHALCDLLSGTASFAEVIRRDPASRLHFLPVGRDGELDLHEFANVIDALAGIYDFIVTIGRLSTGTASPEHSQRTPMSCCWRRPESRTAAYSKPRRG